ncbi:hypothetical protein C922_05605 [Plasmodium inui San Antonio 1]|uniref:Plasmodium RESA N-terminal domain-containing protein n=1 Tax=Plasmodium inui San Antonio 1 TaxID=1237626 RepID=W6ZXP6_9APIC|nr:hypothetical protein C922_05605 [Plasmodium inui San Antonio 1]EUD64010.1 hypothetical protein C922_05605 [Plasmodium inui San Antonio 1]
MLFKNFSQKITPSNRNVMANIEGKNLSDFSQSESDDDMLSVFDEMDLTENEQEDALDSDQIVEGKYEEENDLCNISSATFWDSEMIFTSDVANEELDELISNIQEVPSKNEIIKMWKRTYALVVRAVCLMLIALMEYFEELKERHQIEEEDACVPWRRLISICFDVLKEKEEHYNRLFSSLILKGELTKEEFVNFLNNCRREAAELRETLQTLGKKELDEGMIPKEGDN